jgi:hypothetical protein
METQSKETHWVVELEEDPDSGDLVLPLPPELLNELGWDVGDTLEWNVDPKGKSFTLSKK